MSDFTRCNKITGVYWPKTNIKDLKFSIKLKSLDSISTLPKLEDFTNYQNDLQNYETKQIEEFTFKWQEKVFSSWELQRYSDSHSCLTDTELNYHDMIQEYDFEPSKLFSYVNEDNYISPSAIKSVKSDDNISKLTSCFDGLKLSSTLSNNTGSLAHLFRSEESIASKMEQMIVMHIILDKSEYNEDSQLLIKQDYLLLSIRYNPDQGYLLLTPDINTLEWNPYDVESGRQYQYSVNMEFEEQERSDDLDILLNKLLKKCHSKTRRLINFISPPLGKIKYFVNLEIVSAGEFEMDDLYVEYSIKIPDEYEAEEEVLKGRTHTSRVLKYNGEETWNFGHSIEISLESHVNAEKSPLRVCFEVISTDWWSRHRTEGYTSFYLNMDQKHGRKVLNCVRPEEKDRVEAENRRFFVGGCHLLKDLDVLMAPQNQESNFRLVSSGSLTVRWNIISQSHVLGTLNTGIPQPSVNTASALLHGADAVLRQYKKARAKLAAATKDLDTDKLYNNGSGDG